MKKIKRWKKIYSNKPSPIYFVYDNEDGILSDNTFGYGKVIYPEGSIYIGDLLYVNGEFHKYGFGVQDFNNTTIAYEEFGGPKGLYVDKFVGMFNHLETSWIYGDGILYFKDENNQPKAFIKGFFNRLTKVGEFSTKFDESILLKGYTLDMEVEQVLHQSRFEYLLEKVNKIKEVDTILIGDSWFELYEMPYWKNKVIYGTFKEDFENKSIINLGIGGATFLEWNYKIDKLISNLRFKNVIINLGFNDIQSVGLNVDLNKILLNLKLLESKIRKYNENCIIYYLGVSPSCKYQFLNKKNELNNMIEEYCSFKENSHFIDTKNVFLNGNEYKDDFKEMFIDNDGNHLNTYGYQKWSVLIKNILNK